MVEYLPTTRAAMLTYVSYHLLHMQMPEGCEFESGARAAFLHA